MMVEVAHLKKCIWVLDKQSFKNDQIVREVGEK